MTYQYPLTLGEEHKNNWQRMQRMASPNSFAFGGTLKIDRELQHDTGASAVFFSLT